ncbi:FecR family protein [Chryseobacterium pennae]|nr:FecR family protein [Chryseobacterium pennae]
MDKDHHQIEPLSNQESEEMWKNVIARIRVQEAKKRKKKHALYSMIMTTAAILIIGGIFIYESYFKPDVYHAKDDITEVVLKDGSQVTLLKGAKLTVDKSFPSDTRDVFLEGNAVFEVSKSKKHPFIVHAGSYEAKVLGTVFKVTQTGTTFNVDLYEGKVQVSNSAKPKESYVIHPKETFSNMGSNRVAIVAPTINTGNKNKNITATLAFTDFYLQDVLKIVEKKYAIKIKFPIDKASSKISILSQEATADELIERISVQLNLTIKKANDNTFELEE